MTTFSFFCANRSTLSWAGRTFEDGAHKMRPATMLAWSRQSQTISIVLDKERSGRDAMIKLSLSAISLLRHGRDIRYCYFSDLCILTSGMRMRDKAGRAMWPFGKKQISVRDATVDFYAKIAVAFEQNYEAILEIFRSAYDEDCPFEEVIYMEVIPAVWALGIEPVQNLWGEAQFKRVRAEMLVQIDQSHSPMTKPLVERFLKHTQLLRAGLAKGSATYNSDHIIKELGLAVQPMTSLKLSTQLAMLVLPYWKELHRTHNIY